MTVGQILDHSSTTRCGRGGDRELDDVARVDGNVVEVVSVVRVPLIPS